MRRPQSYNSTDFGSISLLERRRADEFYDALTGFASAFEGGAQHTAAASRLA
jgi:hypothetical protein